MQVILIVLESDIPSAILYASSLADSDYYTYVFDPKLLDLVVAKNFRNVRILAPAGMPDYKSLDRAAQKSAKNDEHHIDEHIRLHENSPSIYSWQNLNFYYFRIAHLWYSELWQKFLEEEPTKNTYQLFVCENPAQYYEPSFLPAILLIEKLKYKSYDYVATVYQQPCLEPAVLVEVKSQGIQNTVYELITHLPTCFYDHEYINQEIHASGLNTLNIKAYQWNPKLLAHKHLLVKPLLIEQLSSERMSIFQQLEEIIAQTLEGAIADIRYRKIQAAHLAKIYISQLVNFEHLVNLLRKWPLKKMILSDHDAGLHGPLIAIADQLDIEVITFPHAKMSSGEMPWAIGKVMALVHPIQAKSPHQKRNSPLKSDFIRYHNTFIASNTKSESISSIGLILPAMSLNGVALSDIRAFIDGIKSLNTWSIEHGIEFKIRCKPNNSIFTLISGLLACNDSLLRKYCEISTSEYIQQIDLGILFDCPSSISIELLNRGVPTVMLRTRTLSFNESLQHDNTLIPALALGPLRSMLSRLVKNSTKFAEFKKNQVFATTNPFPL